MSLAVLSEAGRWLQALVSKHYLPFPSIGFQASVSKHRRCFQALLTVSKHWFSSIGFQASVSKHIRCFQALVSRHWFPSAAQVTESFVCCLSLTRRWCYITPIHTWLFSHINIMYTRLVQKSHCGFLHFFVFPTCHLKYCSALYKQKTLKFAFEQQNSCWLNDTALGFCVECHLGA